MKIRSVPYHIAMAPNNQDGASRKSSAEPATRVGVNRGRPRSDRVHRAILDATRELLVADGFDGLRLERVAARAGVGDLDDGRLTLVIATD